MIIHPINNLRIVSVTLVLMYHYFPGRVPGGLIGVDIFFFISGYLMAYLIGTNRSIGAWAFLKRRIDRLLPALILYLAVIMFVYALILFPQQKAEFLENVFASVFFIKNLQLSLADTYFVGLKYDDPVLVLWSLSVEFQAYLIFAAALMITSTPQKFHQWILFLTTISLLYFILNHFQGGDNFYSIFSRFWQLGIGACLFYWLGSSGINVNSKVAILGSLVSFSTLAILALFYVSDLSWPSLTVLVLPVILSAIIVFNYKSLYSTSMIYPITYEIYLYHWLFLCLGVTLFDLSTNMKFALLFLTLVSSVVFHHITKFLNYKILVCISLFSLIFFVTIPSVRSANEFEKIVAQADFPQSCRKDVLCIYGNQYAKNFLVIGDSHAELLSHALYSSGVDNTLTRIRGCNFINDESCLLKTVSLVNSNAFEHILFSICSVCINPKFDASMNSLLVENMVKLRQNFAGSITIVSDNPIGAQFDPKLQSQYKTSVVDSAYFEYVNDQKNKFEMNGFRFFDLNQYICNFDCAVKSNGKYLYSDMDHLRPWVFVDYGIVDDLIQIYNEGIK